MSGGFSIRSDKSLDFACSAENPVSSERVRKHVPEARPPCSITFALWQSVELSRQRGLIGFCSAHTCPNRRQRGLIGFCSAHTTGNLTARRSEPDVPVGACLLVPGIAATASPGGSASNAGVSGSPAVPGCAPGPGSGSKGSEPGSRAEWGSGHIRPACRVCVRVSDVQPMKRKRGVRRPASDAGCAARGGAPGQTPVAGPRRERGRERSGSLERDNCPGRLPGPPLGNWIGGVRMNLFVGQRHGSRSGGPGTLGDKSGASRVTDKPWLS